jgi:lipopolysaccharide/colanic/teichoic acid biosynthesis glycosyltransferase
MTCGLAGLGITVKGDARVTKIGRVLRKWKIDELPSLVNVLSGEMSLVGPRPEVPQYVDLANPLWRRILEVRPGLTDPTTIKLRDEEILLASVTGNYESYYRDTLQPRKMAGYATYIESRSWRGDLAILFKTLISIARPSVDRSDIVSQKLDAEEVPKG